MGVQCRNSVMRSHLRTCMLRAQLSMARCNQAFQADTAYWLQHELSVHARLLKR